MVNAVRHLENTKTSDKRKSKKDGKNNSDNTTTGEQHKGKERSDFAEPLAVSFPKNPINSTRNGDDFMQKNAFHTLSYGVYAVTAMDGERPVGCIANSAMQITSQPPTLAISINQQNYTHDIIQKTGKLAVCVLPEQTDLSVIGTFGFQSSREVEKFAEIAYDQKDGLPVLKQCCAWFTLEVVQQMNAGTHIVFLAKVLDCDRITAQQPMTYAYYHNVLKMKSPKAAPTYVEE